MVFHWSLSDSKSQVTRSLLSILLDLNNAVVWIVSIHPVISKSHSPYTNPLVTVPRAPITIGIILTFMFHSFFHSPSKAEVFKPLFTFFIFFSVVRWDKFCKFLFCIIIIIIIIIRSCDFFHTSVSRWFLTGVWVTASLQDSSSVFWPFSIMLSFGWSSLVCQLPSPLIPLAIL